MRCLLVAGFGALLVILSGPGCGAFAGVASDGGVTDGSSDSASTDAANDGAIADGNPGDGDGGDGAIVCQVMGGTYGKDCADVSDCAMVGRGCHCGAQPVIGVSKSVLAAAEACEDEASNHCPLGCSVTDGHVAEDGTSDTDGGTIVVMCQSSMCRTSRQ